MERDFEVLTTCFNEWLCNSKNPHESWADKQFYNALCDVNEVIYKTKDIVESKLANYIQQVWIRRFNDKSKSFDEYMKIAGTIIEKGFFDLYD